MSLEKCKECQTLMSDKAQWCLNCGYPIGGEKDSQTSQISSHGRAEKPKYLIQLGIFASFILLIVLNLAQIGN